MTQYGLIGFPLRHSFSMGYFNEKFANEGINAEYVNFELPSIDAFPDLIKENIKLNGLNVTIPYKEKVIKYLNEMDATAKAVGAVNVIKFIKDKKGEVRLKGYNCDVIGFQRSIDYMLENHHQGALILGAGGAAKAAYYVLKQLGLDVKMVSRNKGEAHLTYSELNEAIMNFHQVIVNATPVGMFPNVDACPDIPYHLLTKRHILYDMLYNPNVTEFMKRGKERGATVKNGLEMLLLQADASWEVWNE
ncbi:shikimate dehydrogenase [Porphyromonadaceae bacterium]